MTLFVPVESNSIPGLRDQGVSEDAIIRVLVRVCQKFTPVVQKAAPVDTGRLKRSLRVELLPDNSGVAVTSPVFYAGFVEYGTRRMRPRSYVEGIIPDLIGYMNDLLSELGQVVRSGVQAVGVGEQSGLTSLKVSDRFLSDIQVRRSAVRSKVVPLGSVTPELVAPTSISPESV